MSSLLLHLIPVQKILMLVDTKAPIPIEGLGEKLEEKGHRLTIYVVFY